MKNNNRAQNNKINTAISKIVGIIVLVSLFTPIYSVFGEVMTSGNYKLQSDSINFSGNRSGSNSYNIEDTQGEIGTGEQGSNNNIVRAGYQQADTASAGSASENVYSGGKGYTGSGVYSSAINVIEFIAIPLSKSISLNWSYPAGVGIESVKIVRSDKFYPVDMNDGEVIFEGIGTGAIDNDVVPGKTYYYALFTKNSVGEYSSGVLAKAIILKYGEKPSDIELDPFANIPNALMVDKLIQGLTLLDFDFIQDGKYIDHTVGIVPIDGKKNLTISLDYKKVPEVLKTIAITLVDPDDSTKIFTFLLRVNKDKSTYEATIAPLKKSGNYKINIIILDYKNQGLKRINGDIKAVVFEGFLKAISNIDIREHKKLSLGILISIIAILIILIIKIKNKLQEKYEI